MEDLVNQMEAVGKVYNNVIKYGYIIDKYGFVIPVNQLHIHHKYKNDDMLYVPTDQLDNVKKYIGGGDALPAPHRPAPRGGRRAD